jgi:pimeloyl-ACP methyl ester carboxylesterase
MFFWMESVDLVSFSDGTPVPYSSPLSYQVLIYQVESALPNDELLVYDGIGHLPMEEAAERFNDNMIAWLAGLATEAG